MFDRSGLFFTAFDMVKDPFKSLDIIIQLGFERILTSGQDSSALEGLPTIKYLIEKVKVKTVLHKFDILFDIFVFSNLPLSHWPVTFAPCRLRERELLIIK